MKELLDKLIQDKTNAMLKGIETRREAIDSVLGELDKRKHMKGFKPDLNTLHSIIKKERDIYMESESRDPAVKAQFYLKAAELDRYLPKQMDEDTVKQIVDTIMKDDNHDFKPALVMNQMDTLGYQGTYDRGLVAKLVMSKRGQGYEYFRKKSKRTSSIQLHALCTASVNNFEAHQDTRLQLVGDYDTLPIFSKYISLININDISSVSNRSPFRKLKFVQLNNAYIISRNKKKVEEYNMEDLKLEFKIRDEVLIKPGFKEGEYNQHTGEWLGTEHEVGLIWSNFSYTGSMVAMQGTTHKVEGVVRSNKFRGARVHAGGYAFFPHMLEKVEKV